MVVKSNCWSQEIIPKSQTRARNGKGNILTRVSPTSKEIFSLFKNAKIFSAAAKLNQFGGGSEAKWVSFKSATCLSRERDSEAVLLGWDRGWLVICAGWLTTS